MSSASGLKPEDGGRMFLHNCTYITNYTASMQWRSWLRHCATSRKVAGSIPDGVTGIFH